MMRQILTSDELRKEFEKNDFVLKTQKQIAKDFFSVGIMFPQQFELESMKMDEIIEQIAQELAQLQSQAFTSLQQLIYQVDLPENLFLEALSSERPELDLAYSILQREAYKVYLRTKF